MPVQSLELSPALFASDLVAAPWTSELLNDNAILEITMRPISKISACVAIACLGLVLLFSSSAWTQEAKKTSPRIKELQQQRLEILTAMNDGANQLYRNGRSSYEEVQDAALSLVSAQLEYAETREERNKACDEAIVQAEKRVELAKTQKAAARGTEVSVLKAKAFVLQLQIEQEKIAAGQ